MTWKGAFYLVPRSSLMMMGAMDISGGGVKSASVSVTAPVARVGNADTTFIGSEPTPVAHRCLQDCFLAILPSDGREMLKRAARSFCRNLPLAYSSRI